MKITKILWPCKRNINNINKDQPNQCNTTKNYKFLLAMDMDRYIMKREMSHFE